MGGIGASGGDIDLATANQFNQSTPGPGDVSILRNNGNGTFAAPQNLTAGNQPRAIVAADLDGDGRPDLAVANYNDGTVSILLQ